MPLYTFYPCKEDGTATSMEAFFLEADDKAPPFALKVMTEHPSCAFVSVWHDARPVLVRRRSDAGSRPIAMPNPHLVF